MSSIFENVNIQRKPSSKQQTRMDPSLRSTSSVALKQKLQSTTSSKQSNSQYNSVAMPNQRKLSVSKISQRKDAEGQNVKSSVIPRPVSALSNGTKKSMASNMTTNTTPQASQSQKLTEYQRQITKIEDRFKKLKHLPKQKLHPFDFKANELDAVRLQFPEFKKSFEGRSFPTNKKGIEIQKLMDLLKERLHLTDEQIYNLMIKLDTKNPSKVSWNEFLSFLYSEGSNRELVNDAQLYGYGVKRLEEKGRYSLKPSSDRESKVVEYFIETMQFIRYKNQKLLFTFFENKRAKLIDLKTLAPIQNIIFQSDYGIPKEIRLKTHKNEKGQHQNQNIHEQQPSSSVNRNVTQQQSVKQMDSSMTSYATLTALKQADYQAKHSNFDTNSNVSGLLRDESIVDALNITINPGDMGIQNASMELIRPPLDQSTDFSPERRNVQSTFKKADKTVKGHAGNVMIGGRHDRLKRKQQNLGTVVCDYSDQTLSQIPEEKERIRKKNLKFLGTGMSSKSLTKRPPQTITTNYNSSIKRPQSNLIGKQQSQDFNVSRMSSMNSVAYQSVQVKLPKVHAHTPAAEIQIKRVPTMQIAQSVTPVERIQPSQKKEESQTQSSTELVSQKSGTDMIKILSNFVPAQNRLKFQKETLEKEFFKKIEAISKVEHQYDEKKEAQFKELFKKYMEKEKLKNQHLMTSSSHDQTRHGMHSTMDSSKNRSSFHKFPKNSTNKKGKDQVKSHYLGEYEKQLQKESSHAKNEIDYIAQFDIIQKISAEMKYIPAALRDQKQFIQICDNFSDRFIRQRNKIVTLIEQTNMKKEIFEKQLHDLKDCNRFFFTSDSDMGPQFVPDPPWLEDREQYINQEKNKTTEDRGRVGLDYQDQIAKPVSKVLLDKQPSEQVTPEFVTQFFMDKQNKAERHKQDVWWDKNLWQQKEQQTKNIVERHKKRAIPLVKEVYTVATDYLDGDDQNEALIGLALIDKQILIYGIKQTGAKVTVEQQFSFYVKFHSGTTVSTMCLARYVTNKRPMACISSQEGDIMIYYLDHVDAKGARGPKLLTKFNFFSRGPAQSHKLMNNSSLRNQIDDSSSLAKNEQNRTAGQFNDISSFEDYQSHKNKQGEFNTEPMSVVDEGNPTSSGIINHKTQIKDEYWEVLMDTNERGDGLNGIQYWNIIYTEFKERLQRQMNQQEKGNDFERLRIGKRFDYSILSLQEISVKLCKELLNLKLDFLLNEKCKQDQKTKKLGLSQNRLNLLSKVGEGSMVQNSRSKSMLQNGNKTGFQDYVNMEKMLQIIDKWEVCLRVSNYDLSVAATNFRDQMNQNLLEMDRKENMKKVDEKRRNSIARKEALYGISHELKRQRIQQLKKTAKRQDCSINDSKEDIGSDLIDQEQKLSEQQQNEKNTHEEKTKPKSICKMMYLRDIGLVVCSNSGTIKFFDSFNFYQTWKNSNKMRTEKQHTNIRTFDLSQSLGVMATGGADGMILLIDPYALGIMNSVEAHLNKEIINIYFYDEQQQIVSVCEDRTINLWDAYRLVKLQTIKDLSSTHIPKYTASAFDKVKGLLFTGDNQVSIFRSKVDTKVEINALQVQTLTSALLKERNMEELLKLEGPHKKKMHQQVQDGNVLISKASSLVDVLINEKTPFFQFVVTVDTENLLRYWNLRTNQAESTFKIPLKKRVTAVDINTTCTQIVVGNCVGKALVINSKSGGIIYQLPGAGEEITSLRYLSPQSEYWIVAACWKGRMLFWSRPNEHNNFLISTKVMIGHRGDVVTLACQNQFIASGGVDGKLSVWNQIAATYKRSIDLPEPINSASSLKLNKRQSSKAAPELFQEEIRAQKATFKIKMAIVGCIFHPYYQNIVLVLQEGGAVHAADVANGQVVAENIVQVWPNSTWAIDKECYKVMIVSEDGKAALYDIRMGAPQSAEPIQENLTKIALDSSSIKEEIQVMVGRVPVFKGEPHQMIWPQIREMFSVHSFSVIEPNYVSSVNYCQRGRFWVTSTNFGEIKMWERHTCAPLGSLNSQSLDKKFLTDYIIGVKEPSPYVEDDDSFKEVDDQSQEY